MIGILRTGYIVKSSCQNYSKKKVIVVVIAAAVLIILDFRISIGNIVKVIKERLANTPLQSDVPVWVEHVLHSDTKGYGELHIAVFRRLDPISCNRKQSDSGKDIGGKPEFSFFF